MFFFISVNVIAVEFLFCFGTIFCCVLPRQEKEALIYLNPLTPFPLWEEIAGGLKQGWFKEEGSTSLSSTDVHMPCWAAGGTVVSQVGKRPSRGSEVSKRWIGYLV